MRDWAESADFDNDGTTETEVVKHITIDAFGNIQSVTDSSGAAISNGASEILHAYTGQLYDADAGLHYYRARWYDTVAGQFVSEDPLGFAAGDMNTSRLVSGKVTSMFDPSGLEENQAGQPPVRPGGDLTRDPDPTRSPVVIFYDEDDIDMQMGALGCPHFINATHIIGVGGVEEMECTLHEISEGGTRPISTVGIIDHGTGEEQSWVQSIGTAGPPGGHLLSPTLLVNILEPSVTEHPTILNPLGTWNQFNNGQLVN